MTLKSIPGAVQICILFNEYNPVLINYSAISMGKYTLVLLKSMLIWYTFSKNKRIAYTFT